MTYIVRSVFAPYGFETVFAGGNDNLWILRHAKKINVFCNEICHTLFPQETYGPFGCVFRNIFLRTAVRGIKQNLELLCFQWVYFFFLNKKQKPVQRTSFLCSLTILKNNFLFLCFSKFKNDFFNSLHPIISDSFCIFAF